MIETNVMQITDPATARVKRHATSLVCRTPGRGQHVFRQACDRQTRKQVFLICRLHAHVTAAPKLHVGNACFSCSP